MENVLLQNLLIFPLAAATICVTVSRGKIFRKQRIWLRVNLPWLGALVSCPYCLTHWIVPCILILSSNHVSLLEAVAMIGESAIFIGLIVRLIGFSSDEPDMIQKLTTEIRKLHSNLKNTKDGKEIPRS